MITISPNSYIPILLRERLLCRRAHDCLFFSGKFYLGDIIKYLNLDAANKVTDIYNLDRKSELQIKYLLWICKRKGEYVREEKIIDDFFEVLDIPFRNVFTEVFQKRIATDNKTNNNLFPDLSQYLSQKYTNPGSLFYTFVRGKDEVLHFQSDITKDVNIVFRRWHIEFLNAILPFLKGENKQKRHILYDIFNKLKKDVEKEFLYFSISDITTYLPKVDTLEIAIEKACLDNEPGNSDLENTAAPSAALTTKQEAKQEASKTNTRGNRAKQATSIDIDTEAVTEGASSRKVKDPTKPKGSPKRNSKAKRIHIPDEISDIIQQKYESMCKERLDKRAMRFKEQHLPSFRDIMVYFDQPLREYGNICPPHTMFKTLKEIYSFVQLFQFEVKDIVELYSREGIEEVLIYKYQIDYPFLDRDQVHFLLDYLKQYNRRPLFFLLYRYLVASERRECVFFSLHYGLKEGMEHSLSEIGEQYGLTRERVRQIVFNLEAFRDKLCITPQELEYYRQQFKHDIITGDSEEFKSILQKENIPVDFGVLAPLCLVILDYKIYNVNDFRFITSPTLNKIIDIGPMVNKFCKICVKHYTKTNAFPLSYFTGLSEGLSHERILEIRTLLQRIALDNPMVTVTEDTVVVKASKVDVSQELYNILDKAGIPLFLPELFARFKEKYPEHHFQKPSQIRPYLCNCPQIRSLGKQSLFGLAHWDHVYFGTIRDFLYETLSKSKRPLHISDLELLVKKHFPSTNSRNLAASLGDDQSNRFVKYECGYYGVTSRKYHNSYLEYNTNKTEQLSLDQRIQEISNFIEENHRYPFNNGNRERKMVNWLHSECSRDVIYSREKRERIDALKEKYASSGYPRNYREYQFLLTCQEFKQHIEKNHNLPTIEDNPKLYTWFQRAIGRLQSFNDQRQDYFQKLCDYLRSEGFDIKL